MGSQNQTTAQRKWTRLIDHLQARYCIDGRYYPTFKTALAEGRKHGFAGNVQCLSRHLSQAGNTWAAIVSRYDAAKAQRNVNTHGAQRLRRQMQKDAMQKLMDDMDVRKAAIAAAALQTEAPDHF